MPEIMMEEGREVVKTDRKEEYSVRVPHTPTKYATMPWEHISGPVLIVL